MKLQEPWRGREAAKQYLTRTRGGELQIAHWCLHSLIISNMTSRGKKTLQSSETTKRKREI